MGYYKINICLIQ